MDKHCIEEIDDDKESNSGKESDPCLFDWPDDLFSNLDSMKDLSE